MNSTALQSRYFGTHGKCFAVWLVHNLTLDGKLCLRGDKNAAFVYTSPSIAVANEHGKRHTTRAHLPDAVSDWLNPFYLGTMSASRSIANLA